ncbi:MULTISPECIES: efflux RND transporter periplasmic adaptor subunit [unclassified Lentimonas]|uniref:efflux RND transporter periplasmic adaptor subunit n=1 Tax=unclassified Lentimonas TaxID=2630993 RepID=UPI001321AE19|nr:MULTISPECIES: efflux RND transporter periplasmic adaptor subunit [unclassified Lentimonas]CAA6677461.1 RND efflux system, membrane fusion protein CmeA [Lentimonas sp. CC4]CAA6686431.1 RND efflux system, membrane fusion protein CmeA [Lentimonas sp. CC6]CAA7074707.1 RND efflux system, membrane fusion protein CmeA [Lentimonas sp. CC4]CAA7169331.1 RND efflux system, membrane fusion protein CmeA [Lentimonas sp. CC21]CAA7180275.1 RND efflux system, membrane fusion protein CmeA [Lentimonas sp. CC8
MKETRAFVLRGFDLSKLGAPMGAAVLASIFAVGCAPEAEVQAPPPPTVTVANPETREVTVYKSYPSTLKGVSEIEMRARVSGYLEDANFEEGGFVKAGEHLFTIEPRPYQLAVEAAEADLARAVAGRELAESRLRRLEEALKSNAVAEVEVDIASAELAQAIASVSQATAQLNNAKLDLSYTNVNAPISGRVSLSTVSDENLVGFSDPTVITTIVDDSVIEAHFEVPEREMIKYLQIRQKGSSVDEYVTGLGIQLELSDGSIYAEAGRIDFMDNKVDSMTRTIAMRAVFDNKDAGLASGLYALVKIPVPPNKDDPSDKNALLVPADAILRDIGGRYVWVVDDQNVVHRRGVDPGDTIVKQAEGDSPAERQTIIVDGVTSEDRIIVMGLQRARDGVTVTPEMAK